MAEKNLPQPLQKPDKKNVEERHEILVRMLSHDIPGSKNIYTGLTSIKGISWSISNAVCKKLNMPKLKKIESLTKDEIIKIESELKNLSVPDYLKNRRFDRETGKSFHDFGSDLDIKKEFDIKRLKSIKSYRGIRHSAKLPVRGQRTRSHFRKKGVAMGVKRKSK